MNLKIYILKKKQLVWSAIIFAVIIAAIIIFVSIRAAQTMNFLTIPNSYKADINNDGKVDSIIVKTDSPTKDYVVNVICSDENGYELEPDSVIKTLGKVSETTPINITFKDIDSDKQEEIFIQASDKNGPILHVYKYKNGNIERLASGRYFMYGHISNTNNKSDILVLASRKDNTMKYSYLKSDGNGLIPYSADSSLNLGIDKISSLLNTVENTTSKPVNLNLDQQANAKSVKGVMLDGIISNIELTDYDTPSKCTYTIRTTPDKKDSQLIQKYKIQLSMNNVDASNPEYSITDIEEIK
jgi:hypothetical protein